MKIRYYKDKELIASRANCAENNTYGTFYPSYIKNARIIRVEQVTEYYSEFDFEFDYKGSKYRLTDKVTGKYSAIGKYYIEKIL